MGGSGSIVTRSHYNGTLEYEYISLSIMFDKGLRCFILNIMISSMIINVTNSSRLSFELLK